MIKTSEETSNATDDRSGRQENRQDAGPLIREAEETETDSRLYTSPTFKKDAESRM